MTAGGPEAAGDGADPGALRVAVEQAQPMPLAGAFACAAGEMVALVGPSGAGKSSMLRVIAGLAKPQRGEVRVGDATWCDTARGVFLPPQRRPVGLVFQQYALMPHLSALDNVALALLSLPRAARTDRARQWLRHVGLAPPIDDRRPAALSGGEQQRVAIARALAREPRLLLLDEPFSAVDPMNRQGLYRLLAELRRGLAIPIVLVTHDLREAAMLADRLVVLDGGRVLQQGPPGSIHRAPRNARVADLVGIQNRFRGRWHGPAGEPGWGLLRWVAAEAVDGGRAAPGGGAGADPGAGPLLRVRDKGRIAAGQPVHWVLTGDAVALAPREPAAPGEFAATVTEARALGEISLVSLRLHAVPGAVLRLTLAGRARVGIDAGRTLTACIDLEQVHVMPVRDR